MFINRNTAILINEPHLTFGPSSLSATQSQSGHGGGGFTRVPAAALESQVSRYRVLSFANEACRFEAGYILKGLHWLAPGHLAEGAGWTSQELS